MELANWEEDEEKKEKGELCIEAKKLREIPSTSVRVAKERNGDENLFYNRGDFPVFDDGEVRFGEPAISSRKLVLQDMEVQLISVV